MKTLKKVPLQLVEVEFIPGYNEMEFGNLYYSKEYQVTNHLCACGCGEQVPLPVSEGGWTLIVENNKPTITPSILQRFECRTHYIVTNGIANIV